MITVIISLKAVEKSWNKVVPHFSVNSDQTKYIGRFYTWTRYNFCRFKSARVADSRRFTLVSLLEMLWQGKVWLVSGSHMQLLQVVFKNIQSCSARVKQLLLFSCCWNVMWVSQQTCLHSFTKSNIIIQKVKHQRYVHCIHWLNKHFAWAACKSWGCRVLYPVAVIDLRERSGVISCQCLLSNSSWSIQEGWSLPDKTDPCWYH